MSGICSLLDYFVNLFFAPQFATESYFFHSGSAEFNVCDNDESH